MQGFWVIGFIILLGGGQPQVQVLEFKDKATCQTNLAALKTAAEAGGSLTVRGVCLDGARLSLPMFSPGWGGGR